MPGVDVRSGRQEHAVYLWSAEQLDKFLEANGIAPKGKTLGHAFWQGETGKGKRGERQVKREKQTTTRWVGISVYIYIV